MPEGRDTDRQGGARIDRNTGTHVDPEAHEEFDDTVDYDQRVTATGDIERDVSDVGQGDWEDDSDDLETEMGRGVDFDEEPPHFRPDPSNPYARKAIYGMWEGVGQIAQGVGSGVSGAANIAFDPLVLAGAAGYYAGKKGLLDRLGRGGGGGNDSPPDGDPFEDGPPPPPAPAPRSLGPLGRERPKGRRSVHDDPTEFRLPPD